MQCDSKGFIAAERKTLAAVLAQIEGDKMSERMVFTHKGIQSIKPRATRFIVWDTKTRGLGLRVTPKGTRSFVFAYRFDGESRMLTLGNTPPLTLEQAIAQHGEAMTAIATAKHMRVHQQMIPPAELDPARAKRQRKDARRTAGTCRDLWAMYPAEAVHRVACENRW